MNIKRNFYNKYINIKYSDFKNTIREKLYRELGKEVINKILNIEHAKCYVFGGFIRNLLSYHDYKDIDFRIVSDINLIKLKEEICCLLDKYGKKQFEAKIDKNGKGLVVSYFLVHRDKTVQCDFTLLNNLYYPQGDFTINTIYFDIKSNKLFDPYYGISDFYRKIIKTCINPKINFSQEKASLIFRLLAMMVETGFSVEEKTYREMIKAKVYLKAFFSEIKDNRPPYNDFDVIKIFGAFEKYPKTYTDLLINMGIMDYLLNFLKKQLHLELFHTEVYANPFRKDNNHKDNLETFILSLVRYFGKTKKDENNRKIIIHNLSLDNQKIYNVKLN